MRWVSGVIERQVGLMTRLVDDLLDVSRITSGKIVLQRGPVAVKSVIAQAVEAARPPAEARGLALEIDVDADVGQVDGDPARLGQAVGNLLDNAIMYTEEDGWVQVEARAAEEDVVISVRDTGVGIAPDLLPHVFELFTQGDRSLERRRGGLGIGLTLVRRLVGCTAATWTRPARARGGGARSPSDCRASARPPPRPRRSPRTAARRPRRPAPHAACWWWTISRTPPIRWPCSCACAGTRCGPRPTGRARSASSRACGPTWCSSTSACQG